MSKSPRPVAAVAPKSASAARAQSKNSSSSLQSRRRYVKKNLWYKNPVWYIVAALILATAVIIVFAYQFNHPQMKATIGGTDATLLHQITSVNSQVFTNVGNGGIQNSFQPTAAGSSPLTGPNGKPEIFFFGAEFCPFCAAERWPLVIALSKFGTFKELHQTASSSTDSSPNTATFTFVDSKYSSDYVDFVPVEAENRDQGALQTPGPNEQAIITKYKVNGFPFIDIAEQFTDSAPIFNPDVLAGYSQRDIASKLTNADDEVTKNIIGSANLFTAAICLATDNKPSEVCTNSTISAIEKSLKPGAFHGTGNSLALTTTSPIWTSRREGNKAA
ncbi:hypothetical protein KTT_57990 [Tengunoibacter tsumagoiensis]|uniref:DUF929 domain-containing protein n=1 Tax=Tengunoibacter tsumagoiensis TaxID=2014871 RepID=A0A402A9X0_9CHLR|nr:hypothetical protein KTT_57990 [Tengunoibacter tsumagoiensis]